MHEGKAHQGHDDLYTPADTQVERPRDLPVLVAAAVAPGLAVVVDLWSTVVAAVLVGWGWHGVAAAGEVVGCGDPRGGDALAGEEQEGGG